MLQGASRVQIPPSPLNVGEPVVPPRALLLSSGGRAARGTARQRHASAANSSSSMATLCALGGVAERSNAAVSKTVIRRLADRGFKSLPLRLSGFLDREPLWFGDSRSSNRSANPGRSTDIFRRPLVTASVAHNWRTVVCFDNGMGCLSHGGKRTRETFPPSSVALRVPVQLRAIVSIGPVTAGSCAERSTGGLN